jgi:hypothetical protein
MFKTNYLFTYIIPFRYRDSQNLNNLKRVIDWVSGFVGVETIVVEQDVTSKLRHSNIRAKHIFCKSTLPMNYALAYNVGLRYSTTEKVCFGNNRLMINPQSLLDGLAMVEKDFSMVKCYDSIIDLQREEFGHSPDQWSSINRPGRTDSLFSGITVFNKEKLLNIVGWAEDFIGNMEDSAMEVIFKRKNMDSKIVPGKAYCLWDPKGDDYHSFLLTRNSQILSELKAMDDNKFNEYLRASSYKMGQKSKYDMI